MQNKDLVRISILNSYRSGSLIFSLTSQIMRILFLQTTWSSRLKKWYPNTSLSLTQRSLGHYTLRRLKFTKSRLILKDSRCLKILLVPSKIHPKLDLILILLVKSQWLSSKKPKKRFVLTSLVCHYSRWGIPSKRNC